MPERQKLIDKYLELMRFAWDFEIQSISPEAHSHAFAAAVAFGRAINLTDSERLSGKADQGDAHVHGHN